MSDPDAATLRRIADRARCAGDEDVEALLAHVATLTRERDGLRAIVEGSSTPTDAEIAAHFATGGYVTCVSFGVNGQPVHFAAYGADIIKHTRMFFRPTRWWANRRDGRPCAWPVVEAVTADILNARGEVCERLPAGHPHVEDLRAQGYGVRTVTQGDDDGR